MLQTYEGILRGDHLRWAEEEPPDADSPLRVHVTILEEEATRDERGQQMAEALSKLAESGAFGAIDDPSEWQRQSRQDRPLPGRDQ
jgi:hypothetical protein